MHFTLCYYHVTYAFQSESTLYICLNVKEQLARNSPNIWSLIDCNGVRTNNHRFVNEHSTIWTNRPNDRPELWVLISTVHFTVCYYYVTYAFHSETRLSTWLNVKVVLARAFRDIWSLSKCNRTQTNNHLFCKRTLNHLAILIKLLSFIVSTDWYGAFGYMLLSYHP